MAVLRLQMLGADSRRDPVSSSIGDSHINCSLRAGPITASSHVLGIKITIHVDTASNQAWVGTDRIFFMRIDGNKLSLKSPSVVIPSGATSVVQLEFLKAD